MRLFHSGLLLVMIMVLVFGLLTIAEMTAMDERSETPTLKEEATIGMNIDICTVKAWTIVPRDVGVLEATSANYDGRHGNQIDLYYATMKMHDLRFLAWTGSLRPGVILSGNSANDAATYCSLYLRHGKGVRGTTILLGGRLEPARGL